MKSGIWLATFVAVLATAGCGGSGEPEAAETASVEGNTPAFDPTAVSAGDGESFYVSPAGRADAAGTAEDPWSLTRAFEHPPEVQPGDTVWVLEGVYGGMFVSTLTGAQDKPVVVRAFPGHKVVIDSGAEFAGPALSIDGADSWFWGLEVLSSNPNRIAPDPKNPERIDRATGVYMRGARSRLINSVVHDAARGLVMTPEAIDAEAYGNLIYHCGWAGGKRGYGSSVSVRNANGSKFLEENIQFAGFENGLQCMGDNVRGLKLRGNVSFNSGVLFENNRTANVFVSAAGDGAQDIRLEENHSYFPLNEPGGGANLGWVYGGNEASVEAVGNYWVGGMTPVEVWNFAAVRFTGNVLAAAPGRVQVALTSPQGNPAGYTWDENQYYGSKFFRDEGAKLDFDAWRAQAGLDESAKWDGALPSGLWSFVRPNRYEPGRANIILYNWDKAASVELDLSEALQAGSAFELRDAQNYHGEPLAGGCYQGDPVTVELPAAPRAAIPVGLSQPPPHSGPVFWALVAVSKTGCDSSAMTEMR